MKILRLLRNNVAIWFLLCIICIAGGAYPGSEVVLNISGPLIDAATTFRFQVTNGGIERISVTAPFANDTRLFVLFPNGKKQSYGNWKEGLLPIDIEPGKTHSWEIDISEHLRYPKKGYCTIWFTVGNAQSNKLKVPAVASKRRAQ